MFEVKNDAKMNRTRGRPLPSGRITIPHAVTWASSMGVAGTTLLASQVVMISLFYNRIFVLGYFVVLYSRAYITGMED